MASLSVGEREGERKREGVSDRLSGDISNDNKRCYTNFGPKSLQLFGFETSFKFLKTDRGF